MNEIYENSQKKVSLIHFVKTTEFTRPFQLIRHFKEKFKRFFIYDSWNGLVEIKFDGDRITEHPIKGDFKKKLIDPVKSMSEITDKLKVAKKSQDGIEKPGNTLVVFQHFDIVNAKVKGVTDLNSALRSLIQNYELRVKLYDGSALVCFLNDPNSIPKDVLDHSLMYNVSGCTEEERRKILETVVSTRKEHKRWLPDDIDIEPLVESGAGLTKIQFNTALVMGFSQKDISPEYISSAKKLILEASSVGKIITPEEALDPSKIGGYEEVKQTIRLIAKKVTESKRADELGCGSVRGVLLFGPPGTGKSLISEAFAKMSRRVTVSISAGDIFSKWYGESARAIRKIIEVAEEAQAVIFIDEIEAVVGSRGNGGTQHEETARTLGELLRYMGDYKRKGIIIGTTNRPDLLDFAMRRAGRFDKILYIPLPDEEARKKIFQIHCKNPIDHNKVKLDKSINWKQLVESTKNFSGAEISQAVKDACDFAFEEGCESVSMSHLLDAIRVNKPSFDEREKMIKLYEKYAKKYCRGIRPKEYDEEAIDIEVEAEGNLGRLV